MTFYADEAGFDSLVGTEETQVPSRIYTEKALCMAKGFLAYALSHDVPALGTVVDWVYLKPNGPRLLQQVVEEAQGLIGQGRDGGRRTKVLEKLSAGAEILLKPHLRALEERAAKAGFV